MGKDPEDAKSEYLNIVKQWAYYGTTFYPPCKSVGNKLPSKYVIIGINYEGIRLLKKNKVREQRVAQPPWSISRGAVVVELIVLGGLAVGGSRFLPCGCTFHATSTL